MRARATALAIPDTVRDVLHYARGIWATHLSLRMLAERAKKS